MKYKSIPSTATQKELAAILKRESDYYPSIILREQTAYWSGVPEQRLHASTLVRINRNNKWYSIHCIESFVFKSPDSPTDTDLLLRLSFSVYAVQVLYQVNDNLVDNEGNPVFEIDHLQISEEERLKKLLNRIK